MKSLEFSTSRISKRHRLFESASIRSTRAAIRIYYESLRRWHVTRSDVTSYVGMTFEIEVRERTRVRPREIGSLSLRERRRRRWARMPSTSTSPLQVGQLDSRVAEAQGDVCDREIVSLLLASTANGGDLALARHHVSPISRSHLIDIELYARGIKYALIT